MAEQIKIYSWWKNQLRIYLEGKHLSKYEKLIAIPGAIVWARHLSRTKDGKAVELYLTAADIVIPESELDQAKTILMVREVRILPNPELKSETVSRSLKKMGWGKKVKNSKSKIQKGGEMERGKRRAKRKAPTLAIAATKELSPDKGVDVLLRFTVAIKDVKLTVAANAQNKKMGRPKKIAADLSSK